MNANQSIPMMTLDPGISDTKIIWRVIPLKPELLLMPPEVVEVTRDSIDFYKGRRIMTPSPENESWVEYGGTLYAVGFFAQSVYGERISPKEIKSEWAIAKVLAAVGVMAVEEGLADTFELALAVPLPYTEWRDRDRFERDVRVALSNFSFCDKPYQVTLKTFACIPEGGGHAMARGTKLGGSVFSSQKIVSCMWGYRDISVVQFTRGVTEGHTEALGFLTFVQSVADRISGYGSRERLRTLLETIHSVGKDIKSKNFKNLALSRSATRRTEEVDLATDAILTCRQEYWRKVSNFFTTYISGDCDEIIIGGGACDYYRDDLKNFFAQRYPGCNISWAAGLEEDVRLTFGIDPKRKALCSRLTDAYGLSSYLLSHVAAMTANNGVKSE